MFSYRHAFHAGNHADVLKHTILIAVMNHLALKEVGFTVIDTHAGAGMYRLDSADAKQSGESNQGLLALMRHKSKLAGPMADLLMDYRKVLDHFNPAGGLLNYPGSPFIVQHLLREQDKLKLFEMHPTEVRALQTQVASMRWGRKVTVMHEDGFLGQVFASTDPPWLGFDRPQLRNQTRLRTRGGGGVDWFETLCHGHLHGLVPDRAPTASPQPAQTFDQPRSPS